MRIVAGDLRGRRLVTPEGTDVRPTSDRVREAVFNALYSLDAIEGATVLDLFAGSGALGFEALSRGAAAVTFIEANRGALAALEANRDALGVADRCRILRGDALVLASTVDPHDLALVDPPYAFDGWSDLLEVVPAPLAVAESDRVVGPPASWRTTRSRSYGGTVVTFLARVEPSAR